MDAINSRYGMQAAQGVGLRIKKLLIHQTGTYNQQYRRPYHTEVSGKTMNMLYERVSGSHKVLPTMMAGLANQFITPTATPESTVDIVGGWNECRMRFMMEIESTSYTGDKIVEVILGYTDHVGVSHSGNVDRNMEFYINSIIQTREVNMPTITGVLATRAVSNNSHVLVNNGWSNIYSTPEHRIRPVDVYTTMSRSHMNTGDSVVLDTRAVNNNIAVKSSRANGTAARYVASILQNYLAAATAMEFGQAQDSKDIYSTARGNADESSTAADPFLSGISQIRQMPVGNTFTFGDLLQLDPYVDNVTVVQFMLPTEMASAHQTGLTASWEGSDRTTHVATILSQSVPGLLMDLALTRVVFMATNRDFTGNTIISIIDCSGFTSGDQSNALKMFEYRLETEVLKDISFDNQTDYAIKMQVDLLGETWIELSLDSGPSITYVTPSFCDALTVPVLTNNGDLAITVASDFESITSQLVGCQVYQNPQQQSIFGKI